MNKDMPTVYESIGFDCILFAKNECPYAGPEKEIKCFEDTVRCYEDDFGSTRFVMYLHGQPVSGLQIMEYEDEAIAANVFTVKDHRRKGYSKIVFQEAIKHFPNVSFSKNQSWEGKRYVEFCQTIIRDSKKINH